MCCTPSCRACATSDCHCSMVCDGSAYIRSMEILSNPASCAMVTAWRACSALCRLPMSCKSSSSKLCTPMLSRLIPSSRHARAFSGVISPGLASRVISCFSPVAFCLIVSSIVCRCSTCSVLGVPPPIYMVDMGKWVLDMGRRSCISVSNASTYCACFSMWVVEKKSQYLQRLLQNGICMYMPAIPLAFNL